MSQKFEINAHSSVLAQLNNQRTPNHLINVSTKFIIPVFQREYSWNSNQVEKLLNDILGTFDNTHSPLGSEPLFIGTMQLGITDSNEEWEIIDGQQRLSTLLLTLQVLKLMFPSNKKLTEFRFDWLESKVSRGEQQKKLQSILALKDLSEIEGDATTKNETNRYEKNTRLIHTMLETYFTESNGLENADPLVDYLLHNLYFVVIETRAGLSKTLQIFDAINTTGLDLNGGDIFKIRMYEYLNGNKESDDNDVFESISALYQKIERYNSEIKTNFTSMREILGIYQYYLIGLYELPKELYTYSSTRFFEELFDTIFGILKVGHFIKHKEQVKLDLQTIEAIIEARYDWEKNWWSKDHYTEEDVCMSHMLWGSRYSTHWRLNVLLNMQLKG